MSLSITSEGGSHSKLNFGPGTTPACLLPAILCAMTRHQPYMMRSVQSVGQECYI